MSNFYLKKKVWLFEYAVEGVVFLLICISFFAGKFDKSTGWSGVYVGGALGVIGVIVILVIEICNKKRDNYRKGLDLESKIEEELRRAKIKCETHVETGFGDLDLYVEHNNAYYGIEVVRWGQVFDYKVFYFFWMPASAGMTICRRAWTKWEQVLVCSASMYLIKILL